MNDYYVFNDLLRRELEEYVVNLTNEIYEDDSLNECDEDTDLTEADNNIEQVYYMLNQYVNVAIDEKQRYNINEQTSIMCKLMIMSQFYEYGLIYLDEFDDVNKQIFIRMDADLSMNNALILYNKYHRDILEMYDFILSIGMDSPDEIDSMRIRILNKNLLKDVLKIYPYAFLDYRFLMGVKFDNEHLRSIKACNMLCGIVSMLDNNQDLDDKRIINEIQFILETNEEIADIVDSNKSYMVANIYTRFHYTHNKIEYGKNFIKHLENKNYNLVLADIKLEDKSLSSLLYCFYLLNKQGLTEEKVRNLRNSITDQKKLQLIKKYNIYDLEEENYFKNGGK